MSKFCIDDQVKNIFDENKSGSIKCIIEKSSNNSTKYSYLIFDKNSNKYFIESEGFIKLIKRISPEDERRSSKMVREIAESSGYKNDIKVGDVVTFRSGLPIGQYAISSIIEMGYGEELHHYELIPINNGSLSTDESCICGRLLLEFQYHDTQWEEYITESVGNGLPPWRGDLYNFFMFYIDPDAINLEKGDVLDSELVKKYKDHTLPPIRMMHIMKAHTIFGRSKVVLDSEDNRKIIAKNLDIEMRDLLYMMMKFNDKIKARNLNDVGPDFRSKIDIKSIPNFTKQEREFARQIDALDKSKGHMKDHYPYELTNLQIMEAIKEAYKNARKIGSKKINISNNPTDMDPDAPYIGKQLYEGYSKKYDLVIQFWYNFDYNFIESAWPVRMNNNAKKY